MAEGRAQTANFHDIEQWRTRLINEGREALTAFVAAHASTDVQQLRQLIKKAQVEQLDGLHTGAGKSLFRYLRSHVS